eukprot:scpid2402/ scgid29729/ 
MDGVEHWPHFFRAPVLVSMLVRSETTAVNLCHKHGPLSRGHEDAKIQVSNLTADSSTTCLSRVRFQCTRNTKSKVKERKPAHFSILLMVILQGSQVVKVKPTSTARVQPTQ